MTVVSVRQIRNITIIIISGQFDSYIQMYVFNQGVEQSNPENKVESGWKVNESFLQALGPVLWPSL